MNSEHKLEEYHGSPDEQARTADLLRLIPGGYSTALDAGARDGYYSALLANRFPAVTAIDLLKPNVNDSRVTCVEGDLTKMTFPDNSFDVVLCTEVLEHIPNVEIACREIMRVAKHVIVIGVPYLQDPRIGQVTCRQCGKTGPAWGHVNTFDETRLRNLFGSWKLTQTSFVGKNRERTNALAAWLMDLGGNPYGIHENESCVHCGSRLQAPGRRGLGEKICAALALRLTNITTQMTQPHPNWIHMVFERPNAG